jgi:hypothetical protein
MGRRLGNASLQKFFCLFLLMLPKKKKIDKKVLLLAGVSKSAAYTDLKEEQL